MRGHYQSGVRKLNKHYQSGGGVGYKTYTYTGMLASLLGFEFNVQTEHYGWNQNGSFYTPSSDNIQTAPLYKISSGLPTAKTEETGYVVYDNWIATSGQSNYGTYTSSNSALRGSYPIWKYGEFRGDPYWAYKNDSMRWAEATQTPVLQDPLNQDNIAASATRYDNYWYNGYSGNYRFEDIYSGMTLKVIIPIVEIIAIPFISHTPAYSEIMLTDETLPISFVGEMKLRYSGSRPSRVQYDWNSWDEGGVMSIIDDASGFYMNCGYGVQLGAYKLPVDQLYFVCKDGNGLHKVAGTSGSYTMIYAMRLVRLEVEDVVAAGKTIIL